MSKTTNNFELFKIYIKTQNPEFLKGEYGPESEFLGDGFIFCQNLLCDKECPIDDKCNGQNNVFYEDDMIVLRKKYPEYFI